MCISVRGVLSRTDRDLVKEWGKGALSHKGKKLYTAMEIREAFFDELSEGHEVIPLGKCDNFDYKTGCRGHEEPEPAKASEASDQEQKPAQPEAAANRYGATPHARRTE